MRVINVEIKARCAEPERVRTVLRERKARFAGVDQQVDTYFRVAHGRLKLREGKIENALIYYQRPNEAGPKTSDVLLSAASPGLKETLAGALGVLVAVEKWREIYYLENVKIHIDQVEGLGSFAEIEAAGDENADRSALLAQCRDLMEAFGIREEHLVAESYSDLLLKLASGQQH
jgi:predicted adenylyl cyclase CyaB